MKTKEEIFHNKLVHYNPKDFPSGMKKAFYKAMEEYAESKIKTMVLNRCDCNLSNAVSVDICLNCNGIYNP